MPAEGQTAADRLTGLSDRLKERVGRSLFDADQESGIQALLRRGPLGAGVAKGRLIPRQFKMFPFTKPSWPTSIARDPAHSDLEMNYDASWARDPWALALRRGLTEGVLRPGIGAIASPTIAGVDRLDGVNGPVIFAANHHSHLDIFLVLASVPRRFRKKIIVVAGADYFFDTRVKAVLSALGLGAIPIERKKVSRTSSDRALEVLRDGFSLIIFPEGGRSADGWGTDFKPGAAFLSTRTNIPVVPIHLEGTGRLLPKGTNVPKRGSTTVTFGLPIRPTDGEDPRDMNQRIESAVAQLADEEANGWWNARRNAASGNTPRLQGPEIKSWRKEWVRTEQEKRHEKTKRSWP
jgi:1-acyl-sn-glycerol-3-phosphate acyltransferase